MPAWARLACRNRHGLCAAALCRADGPCRARMDFTGSHRLSLYTHVERTTKHKSNMPSFSWRVGVSQPVWVHGDAAVVHRVWLRIHGDQTPTPPKKKTKSHALTPTRPHCFSACIDLVCVQADCFHPSAEGQAVVARGLFENLLQPVGQFEPLRIYRCRCRARALSLSLSLSLCRCNYPALTAWPKGNHL